MSVEQLNEAYQTHISKLFDVLCEGMGMAGDNQTEYDNAIKRFYRGAIIADKAYQVVKSSTLMA